jgi:hypothetical protein
MRLLDTDNDGTVDLEEAKKADSTLFDKLDRWTVADSKEDCSEPRHTGVRHGTNIVRWGIATLATYGNVAIVITIIVR